MRVRLLKTFARESGSGREGQILINPTAEYLAGLEYEILDPPVEEVETPPVPKVATRRGGRR